MKTWIHRAARTVARDARHGTTRAGGFTLIELMVAVAVVAILAAVSYPSYADHVLRARLVDATNSLSATRARMEMFYQDNRTYVGGPCQTSQTAGLFTVVCLAKPDATTYTITATGSGTATGFVFTIDQLSSPLTTGLPAKWGTVPAKGYPCWVMRKGETC